jgi:hypothetical protein
MKEGIHLMILFCEYVIPVNHREAFLHWVDARPQLWLSAELLENTGQPGVYVEIWRTTGEQEAEKIQKERLGGRSEWTDMHQWVKGGPDGLRLWIFRPVIPGA